MARQTEDRFLARVEGYIRRNGLLDRDDAVLVAVSGGPDSVALLLALNRLAPSWGWRLSAAHLHHGLRGAADADLRFVVELTRSLGVSLVSARVDTRAEARGRRLSLETAARRLRYQFLDRWADAGGCRRVALGHQRNDNAELVLMNLIRGTGPLGLAAMAPLRAERYIRPLLDLDRRDILDFLQAAGADYREDETNRELAHTRNRVRRILIPLLARRFNPAVVAALNRTAVIARDEEDWLTGITGDLFHSVVESRRGERIVMRTEALGRLHPAARRRVLRYALGQIHPDRHHIGWDHIEALCALILARGRPRRLHLPHRIEAQVDALKVVVGRSPRPLRRPAGDAPVFCCRIEAAGVRAIPELGLTVAAAIQDAPPLARGLSAGQWSAFFDMGAVSFPLVVRSAAAGDRFRPLGAGGTQKVAKFFIDHKIPRPLRPTYPVVESRGEIVWLAGLRIGEGVGAPAGGQALAMVFRPAAAPRAPAQSTKEPSE